MSILSRFLNLSSLLKQKSVFLFGPRSTGKTTLIRQELKNAKIYDLLDRRVFSKLLKNPELLEEENHETQGPIVIDEIQKLPLLLDEVHRLIEGYGWKFLLTGSSARKLRHGGANLLAGRAWWAELFPFTSQEIPNFDLLQYLNRGGLPTVYFSQNPSEELESYMALYLKEEIQAESLTRNLPSFAHFLDAIGVSSGEEINFESFARDCGVSASTVKNYIEILNDTLVGFPLPGFTETKKRKPSSRIKYYLFDVGVINTLAARGPIQAKSELFGKAFEQFLIQEIRAYLSYKRLKFPMAYWRSTSQLEVDLIVGKKIAIEFKASSVVQDKHLKGLKALKEEGLIEKFIVVSLDESIRRTKEGIWIYPWNLFLTELWQDRLLVS